MVQVADGVQGVGWNPRPGVVRRRELGDQEGRVVGIVELAAGT